MVVRESSKLHTRVRFPLPAPIFIGMMNTPCQCLSDFMKTQIDVISKHLDEHKYLRNISDKNEAIASFINDYGWLIRELYCTRICPHRESCEVAIELKTNGDLLRNHIKHDI